MSLRIRLARGGAKKRPYYRIVVADARMPRDGRFIERIGSYNPMLPRDHADRIVIDVEKAKAWIAKGALPSDRVARFLGAAGAAAPFAIPEQTKKSQPRAKTLERMKEEEARQAAAAEAEAAKAAEAEAAAAAPAPEAAAAEAPAETPASEEAASQETPAEEAPAAEESEKSA